MNRLTIALTAAILLLLASCYTDKQASKAVTKAVLLKPLIAAKLTRVAFPCIVTKSDTVTAYIDTTILVDCPPASTEYFTVTDTLNRIDTLYSVQVRRVPVTLPVRVQTITLRIEDSAKITVLVGMATAATLRGDELKSKLDKYNGLLYSIKWLFTFWQVWLVMLALVGYWQRHKIVMLLTGIPTIK